MAGASGVINKIIYDRAKCTLKFPMNDKIVPSNDSLFEKKEARKMSVQSPMTKLQPNVEPKHRQC